MTDNQIREQLALACRVLYSEGHDHYHLGHLSARSSAGDTVWVKPTGIGLDEVEAEDIVLMDMQGQKLQGERGLHNEMPIHTEIYKRRPEVQFIVHTHPFYASALASSQARFEMVSQDSIFFARGVGWYPSAELVMVEEQGQRVAEALGELRAVLMRSHGITVVGETAEDAVVWAASLERSCHLQFVASQFGPLLPIDPQEVQRMAERFETGYAGRNQTLWGYMLRRAQRRGFIS